MGTVIKMKFVLTFIGLVASVASVKDIVLANTGKKKSMVLEKNISRKLVMVLEKTISRKKVMVLENMDKVIQENIVLASTDMKSQVRRLNTTGENGQIGTTV